MLWLDVVGRCYAFFGFLLALSAAGLAQTAPPATADAVARDIQKT